MSLNSNIISVSATLPSPENTFYGMTPPSTTGGYTAGDTWYVTPLGTQADSANATEMWRFDGIKWVKLPSGESAPTGQNVYIDTENPATATIFDIENPPVTNDDALKQDSANTYFGTDGSVWTWNGTAYVTKTYSFTTHQINRFVATANQTTFTLSKTPIGKIDWYRNGVCLPLAFTNVWATVTYVPANNGTKTIDANDIIHFNYEAY